MYKHKIKFMIIINWEKYIPNSIGFILTICSLNLKDFLIRVLKYVASIYCVLEFEEMDIKIKNDQSCTGCASQASIAHEHISL